MYMMLHILLKSKEIKDFIIELLECNSGKKVYLALDNAKTHNNHEVQEFWSKNTDRLVLINTPVYSPQLNPQENIWNLLKNKVFTIGAKDSTDSLFEEVNHLYNLNGLSINTLFRGGKLIED